MGFELWRRVLRNAEINTGGLGECPKRIDQCRTICNECRTVLQICFSFCTMLNFRSMTNLSRMSPISFADSPIAVPNRGARYRVLLLRLNSFDDRPKANGKRISMFFLAIIRAGNTESNSVFRYYRRYFQVPT